MVILVVDVEATCWPDEQPELRKHQREISEIIEIGAVRLRGPDLDVDGEYQSFVRPIKHPLLSPFCCTLTSITQEQVDASLPFPEAWAEFCAWFNDDLPDVVMASWSAYDHVLFSRQCAEHGLSAPPWEHLDVKQEYGQWAFLHSASRGRVRLADALKRVGVEQEGWAHRAIVDARHTAELFRRLRSPEHLAPMSLHVLAAVAGTGSEVANAAELRGLLSNPGRWYYRVRKDLVRAGLCEELSHGRGLRLTERGVREAARIDPSSLPSLHEPEPPAAGQVAMEEAT